MLKRDIVGCHVLLLNVTHDERAQIKGIPMLEMKELNEDITGQTSM